MKDFTSIRDAVQKKIHAILEKQVDTIEAFRAHCFQVPSEQELTESEESHTDDEGGSDAVKGEGSFCGPSQIRDPSKRRSGSSRVWFVANPTKGCLSDDPTAEELKEWSETGMCYLFICHYHLWNSSS
jgi:hypothetical protein